MPTIHLRLYRYPASSSLKMPGRGEGKPLTYGFGVSQLLNVFSDFVRMHKPAERKQALENDPGYNLSAQVVFTAPMQVINR